MTSFLSIDRSAGGGTYMTSSLSIDWSAEETYMTSSLIGQRGRPT